MLLRLFCYLQTLLQMQVTCPCIPVLKASCETQRSHGKRHPHPILTTESKNPINRDYFLSRLCETTLENFSRNYRNKGLLTSPDEHWVEVEYITNSQGQNDHVEELKCWNSIIFQHSYIMIALSPWFLLICITLWYYKAYSGYIRMTYIK